MATSATPPPHQKTRKCGNLGDTELGQFHLELFQNFIEFLLILGPQLGAFQLTHFTSEI